MWSFLESTKPGVNVTVLSLEPPLNSTEVHDDLGQLAIQALPDTFCNQVRTQDMITKIALFYHICRLLWPNALNFQLEILLFQPGIILPFPPEQVQTFSDMIISVEGNYFHCHQVSS